MVTTEPTTVTTEAPTSTSERTTAKQTTTPAETTVNTETTTVTTEAPTIAVEPTTAEPTTAEQTTTPVETTVNTESTIITTEGPTNTAELTTVKQTISTPVVTTGSSETMTQTATTELGSTYEQSSLYPTVTPPSSANVTVIVSTESSTATSNSSDFVCIDPGKYPDPNNCSRYILCTDTVFELTAVSMECPEGSLYDSYNELCTTDPVQCPGEIQLTCTAGGTFEHPEYCNRYYVCKWNYVYNKFELKQYLCPSAHAYDSVTESCVSSDYCGSDGYSKTTTAISTTSTGNAVFVCDAVGKFPDASNCSRFHLCVNASPDILDILMECPKGTLYDSYNEKCTTSPVQCPRESQLSCSTEGKFAHPDDCNRFYVCNWNYIYEKYELRQYRCPINSAYDEISEQCVESSTCNSTVPAFTCTEEGYFAVEYNCKNYYECKYNADGVLVQNTKICGSFKLFDRELRKCRPRCFVDNCPYGVTVTDTFPNQNKNNFNLEKTSPKIISESVDKGRNQPAVDRPNIIDTVVRAYEKSKDFVSYYENRDDGLLKCLCWAELFIITENNRNKEKNVSNEFSIILESPGNITENNVPGGEVEIYTILDRETNKRRTLKFAVVNKTDEITIKEHKTVHCGAGPVLIKTFTEWPKVNKQKIEIRLTPSVPSKWQIYGEDYMLGQKQVTSPSSQTFDTTNTEGYTFTDFEQATVSLSKINKGVKNFYRKAKPIDRNDILKLNKNINFYKKDNNSDKSSQSQQKKITKFPNINFHKEKNTVNNSKPGMKREQVVRSMYFKKLSDGGNIFNMTEPNFFVNPQHDNSMYFFDLLYPNKSQLVNLEGHHRFIINVDISIEHVFIENVNGTEQEIPESILEMEEESVYRLKNDPVL
ncbi:hypothetical protein NQ315_003880 [Exocentrus adspersus]|uniref:Chitin-binding type-2 domain-containing protein n=1 Tax=Exocentrus adspersus TaxID=1586481 RepID=A0AAV8VZH7_9CUCU|nr:hypothetical protein NQ315_003880 [Exocentrus adspersus]